MVNTYFLIINYSYLGDIYFTIFTRFCNYVYINIVISPAFSKVYLFYYIFRDEGSIGIHIVPTEPVFGSLPFSKPVLQVLPRGWHEYESRKPLITYIPIINLQQFMLRHLILLYILYEEIYIRSDVKSYKVM